MTTTLFARLLLADMFIHGLGGGKYDELTDSLMRDFYGIEPPSFLVLTGTLRLPFQKTFWSPGYGLLVDRFGVPWEINCEP